MGSSNPDPNVYAPPESRLGVGEGGVIRRRFWSTCLVCALALVVLAQLPLEWSTAPALALTLLTAGFWLAPVLWILLPDLRRLGLKDAVLIRFVEISIKYVVHTAFLCVVIFLLWMLAYTLIAIHRDPSMLDHLSSPD